MIGNISKKLKVAEISPCPRSSKFVSYTECGQRNSSNLWKLSLSFSFRFGKCGNSLSETFGNQSLFSGKFPNLSEKIFPCPFGAEDRLLLFSGVKPYHSQGLGKNSQEPRVKNPSACQRLLASTLICGD